MSDVPPHMAEASKSHLRRSMQENPELWIEAARFASLGGPGREARLALIRLAAEARNAPSLPLWRAAVSDFSSHDLRAGGRTSGDNPDRPARAFYVKAALEQLLELVEAPPSICEELDHFFQTSQPKEAPKRAAVQAVLMERPDLTNFPSEIAALAGCDRKLVERYLADGTVQSIP